MAKNTNCVDCAYYVMRFMKEIISHKRLQIPEVIVSFQVMTTTTSRLTK
ncbi:hypothetical protein SOVF_094050 isoform A [Spinacia oleracea]|nr:hypothetical protein SOVF_094050 isoform A [Spinacia oleracea]